MEKLNNPTQEQWFNFWIEEAIEEGFILEFVPEKDIPKFLLFDGLSYNYIDTNGAGTKEIIKKDTLLFPLSYTPDGIIIWDPRVKDVLFNDLFEKGDAYFKAQFIDDKWVSILDVKAPTGVNRNADLPFSFTRKWMWQKLNLYVNKVMNIPPKAKDKGYLFKDVWTPKRYFLTDKMTTRRSINYRTTTVDLFKIKYKL